MSNNTIMTRLSCEGCQLKVSALYDLFKTLHNKFLNTKAYIPPGGVYYVCTYGNPGTDYCDVSIAEERGWKVLKNN